MNRYVARGIVAALLASLSAIVGIHPAHASLAFCRTDPAITFKTADGKLHQVLLTTRVGTDKTNVANVAWTATLPAGSTLIQVSRGGPLRETVAVDSGGSSGEVVASADVESSASAEVDVQGRVKRDASASDSAIGTTNQPVSITVVL